MTMPAALANDIDSGSPARFGYQWKLYSEMRPEYEEQFRRWTPHLRPEDWCDKVILDVGCGMGRNTYWPLSYGAKTSVSIDVDEKSLASARATLAPFPNASVEHMSAYDIRYCGHFDIAYSIGVIHHLKEPALALRQMVKALKPHGLLLIWVYGLENNEWIVSFVDPIRRAVLSRLPILVVHHLSLYPALLLWLLLRVGLGKIEYFQLLRRMSFRQIRNIVFDQMLPRIANYWSRDTVERLMRDCGLEDVTLSWVNEMSWAAAGRKPKPLPQGKSPR